MSSSSSSSSPWMWGSLLVAGVVGLVALGVAQQEEEPKKKDKKHRSRAKSEPDDSESTEIFQVKSIESRQALVKGDRYIRSGKLDAAAVMYDKAIKKLGSSEEAAAFYYQRGCLRLHKKMYKLAVNDGTSVIKLKPLLPHGYQLRAFALLNLDQLEETVLDYEQAVELERTLETKHKKHVRRKGEEKRGLRVPNLWTHQYVKEEDDLEKTQEESENDEEEDLAASISSLSSSVSSISSLRSPKKKRVSFLEQTGNIPVETIPSAKIMLVSCIASLGTRCLNVGQHGKAVEYLRRTQELAPLDYENWLINAQITQCYLSLGDGENALSFSKKVLNHKPEDPRGYYMSGEALLLLNRNVDAAEAFAKALQLNPKYGEAKRKLAQAKSLAKEEKRDRS